MRRAIGAITAVLATGAVAFAAVVAPSSAAPRSGARGELVNREMIAAVSSSSASLLPPPGTVLTGDSAGPVGQFQAEVGKHPAVYGEFVTWGQSIHWAFNDAAAAHSILMLHISTTMGAGAPQTTNPGEISRGDGDRYLLFLSGLIAKYGKPVYVRLFPEMDNANNAYASVNLNGSSRGPDYSPKAFIAAWRRVAIVLRGGPVANIDAQLEALGQPPLRGAAANTTISLPPVSFFWCPQVAGLPDVPGNSPAAYYPGNAYVDWVGTDFYSQFPNFTGLDSFYKEFPAKPFAFGEWAIWGGDDPNWVDQLFQWVNMHSRVHMMLYNSGYVTNGPFRLNLDPLSSAAIRHQLAASRYLAQLPAG